MNAKQKLVYNVVKSVKNDNYWTKCILRQLMQEGKITMMELINFYQSLDRGISYGKL